MLCFMGDTHMYYIKIKTKIFKICINSVKGKIINLRHVGINNISYVKKHIL